jgi:hypothetical protein
MIARRNGRLEPVIGPAGVHVDVHVGGGRLGAAPVFRRAPDHPADRDDLVGACRALDQVDHLAGVHPVELGGVAEVGDRALVVEQREPAAVEAEVVAVRSPVGDQHGLRRVLRGGHVRVGADVQPVAL